MRLGLKAGALLGVVISTAALGYIWYLAKFEGKIPAALCLIGPMLLPISLALLVLPPHLILVPKEIDGRMVYDPRGMNYTTLGGAILSLGFIAGFGLLLYLTVGF